MGPKEPHHRRNRRRNDRGPEMVNRMQTLVEQHASECLPGKGSAAQQLPLQFEGLLVDARRNWPTSSGPWDA